jgi:hypothetical protein
MESDELLVRTKSMDTFNDFFDKVEDRIIRSVRVKPFTQIGNKLHEKLSEEVKWLIRDQMYEK